MIFSGDAGIGTIPSGKVLGRWIRVPMIEFRELAEGERTEGDWDEADESRDVGESNGGERFLSRLVVASRGFSVLAWETTGRMVSAKVLGLRSRGSVSVLAR